MRVAIVPSARRLAIFASREATSKAPVFLGVAVAVAAGVALLVYLVEHIGVRM